MMMMCSLMSSDVGVRACVRARACVCVCVRLSVKKWFSFCCLFRFADCKLQPALTTLVLTAVTVHNREAQGGGGERGARLLHGKC